MAFDMARFAAEDTVAVSAEAASTHPVQCGALKKGGLVVLKVTSIIIDSVRRYILFMVSRVVLSACSHYMLIIIS